MKKVLFVCMAFALSFLTNTTNAQAIKIGSFDEESVLGLMPGIQKVDSLLQQYLIDSLKPEYDYALSEYQRLDSTFKADSVRMNPSMKAVMKKNILTHFTTIQGFQQYQQQKMGVKQQELLRPFMERIYDALRVVIQEQKYTHVFKKDAFVYADKDSELMLRVIVKMKIPAAKEAEEQLKALGITTPATGGGGGAKPATTGGTKPAPKKP